MILNDTLKKLKDTKLYLKILRFIYQRNISGLGERFGCLEPLLLLGKVASEGARGTEWNGMEWVLGGFHGPMVDTKYGGFLLDGL